MMSVWLLDDSTVLAKGPIHLRKTSKGGSSSSSGSSGSSSSSSSNSWSSSSSSGSSYSNRGGSSFTKPKARYSAGTVIIIWSTGSDGELYKSTSDLCPIEYCTIEGDDGLQRCGDEYECYKAMNTGNVVIWVIIVIVALVIFIIAKIMCGNKCKRCKKCFKKCKKCCKADDDEDDSYQVID